MKEGFGADCTYGNECFRYSGQPVVFGATEGSQTCLSLIYMIHRTAIIRRFISQDGISGPRSASAGGSFGEPLYQNRTWS